MAREKAMSREKVGRAVGGKNARTSRPPTRLRTNKTPTPPQFHHSAPTTPSSYLPFLLPRRAYASPCNLRLGAPPPPPPLTVRYGPRLVDAFVDFADGVEAAVPGLEVDGDVTDAEGAFEVAAPDGQQLWSGLAAGRPPTVEEAVAAVRAAGGLPAVAGEGEEASCPV